MQKTFLSLIAITMLFAGCSKEIDPQDELRNRQDQLQSSTRTASSQSLMFSTEILKFSNMAELETTVADLARLSSLEREDWFATHTEFVSMEAASTIFNDKIKKCTTLQEVLALREVYSDIFIFDPSSTIPVSAIPYFKTSKSGYQWVCNAYGDVEIAGQIINLNDMSTYAQTLWGKIEQESVLAKNPQTRSAYALYLNHMMYMAKIATQYNGGDDDEVDMTAIYMNFESGKIISSQWVIPSEDTFTLYYNEEKTDLSAIDYPTPIFRALNGPGASVNFVTTNGAKQRVFVGHVIGYKVNSTGYLVSSRVTGQSGIIGISY